MLKQTQGDLYVDKWLDDTEPAMDYDWVAAAIDRGYFVICPRCYFLHTPQIAWWLGGKEDDPLASGGCDVCSHVTEVKFHEIDKERFDVEDEAPEGGWQQSGNLRRMRTARAWLLHNLWWSGYQSAQQFAATMAGGAWNDIRVAAEKRTPDEMPPLSL